MKCLKLGIDVAAPPERAFEVFTDLRNAPSRVEGIKSLEVLTDGPVAASTVFRETRVMFGKEAVEEMRIGEFEDPSRYTVLGESCGVRFETEFRFTPTSGGTRVDQEVRSTPLTFGAKVMGALMGWMMTGAMRKAMQADLDDLARFCATDTGAG